MGWETSYHSACSFLLSTSVARWCQILQKIHFISEISFYAKSFPFFEILLVSIDKTSILDYV